jgi:hypothetical protein
MKFFSFLTLTLLIIIAVSCNKKNEYLEREDPLLYYPTKIGKTITYKVDSTNYIGYDTTGKKTTYYAQDLVESKTTDNLGRESYRVIRYYKKNLTDPSWVPNSTYLVTPLEKSIETIENNMRFIKLQGPITPTFTWKGNTHIETTGAFSSVAYLYDWEYQYDSIKAERKYGQFTFPETIKVLQTDATDGILTDPNGYSERNYSVEIYAKYTGLIYKDFLHWSYQPPNGGAPGYRSGYGLRLTVIDKN